MTAVEAALQSLWLSEAAGIDYADDLLTFISLAGCSLDEKPGSNWVQDNGGLPTYICQLARAIKRSGHDTGEAIQLAVGTARNWASGQKNVTAKTRAKAAAAVAEWEALKARAHAHSAAKAAMSADGTLHDVLYLCADTFNTDVVRNAFDAQLAKSMFPQPAGAGSMYPSNYSYINQLWSNFIIVNGDLDNDGDCDYYKIPFSVDPDDQTTVTFGTPIEVKQEWITGDGDTVSGKDGLSGADLTDDDMDGLLKMADSTPVLDKFLALAAKSKGAPKPYGDVKYADPKNGKYPVDTAEHARAAWAYINKDDNAAKYPLNGVALSTVKSAIKAACSKFGIDITAASK